MPVRSLVYLKGSDNTNPIFQGFLELKTTCLEKKKLNIIWVVKMSLFIRIRNVKYVVLDNTKLF